ncbi:hypothetical protein BTM25_29280 [Actinomadura rubteroloni]|uniref:Uncharacterized protein n=1 Tax=Actinomadura rubteroloni TaxID=1926885 RepID=A0A2P4UH03_9ACTN|nr:hypothetical protein [Actinomadura rubteroloni]POM24299.1 hypothetical protein BTM25_29280 [Actinomadura rubteroloni]
MTKRERAAALVAGGYAVVVVAVAIDAAVGLRTDDSGLSALGLLLVTLPLGAVVTGVTDALFGASLDGLKPGLPVLMMVASGFAQAWLLRLVVGGLWIRRGR